MTDKEQGESGESPNGKKASAGEGKDSGAGRQADPPKSGGLRFLLTVVLLVLLATNLPSFFDQMARDALAVNSYSTVCPEDGGALLEAMNGTGLFPDSVDDIFPIGHESASSGYVVPNVDCTFRHVVYDTRLNPSAAKVNLASNGWVITEDGPGLFSASKVISDVTYTVTYPDVDDGETTAGVTFRGSR